MKMLDPIAQAIAKLEEIIPQDDDTEPEGADSKHILCIC